MPAKLAGGIAEQSQASSRRDPLKGSPLMLEMFTEPRGVAVVGASASPDKLGYQVAPQHHPVRLCRRHLPGQPDRPGNLGT